MASLHKMFYLKNLPLKIQKRVVFHRLFCVSSTTTHIDDEEFRVLELYPVKSTARKGRDFSASIKVLPPREKSMPIDQDWPSVWPTAKTFRPSVVPLPLHQGYDQKRVPPGKYANTELMKIPNFLHLTPPAIKRHTEAIKKFCTDWPKGLETEEDITKHFPVEIITSDFCHSSPTIRDERSRIVQLKIKLQNLNLDYHGRDKLLRLIGKERYNSSTDMVTLVADRCPLRKQNYDYLIYLLTAIHHESWITEPWEHEKTEVDMEKFFFENSRIENKIIKTIQNVSSTDSHKNVETEEIKGSEIFDSYGKAITNLINEGESKENLENYKASVMKALGIEKLISTNAS